MATMSAATHVENDKPPIDTNTLTRGEKKELIAADAISVNSTTFGTPDLSFAPAKSLHINAKGIPILGFAAPPAELVTRVHNFDGSVAYTSTRAKRSSGSCVLTDADGMTLISTKYFCGTKDPVLNRLDASEGIPKEIKTVSKWTSRSHEFLLPDGRTCAWTYRKEKGFGTNGAKGNALVLMLGEKRIAVLVRNDDTRTSGSNSYSAGNGGELVLGEDVGGNHGIDEALIVATILLMLKKEIDRRRTVQVAITASAGS
ncbi:uncharacterized protein K460DRAFT_202013 [Cucurbitaria berberidis CBS 394.84]|uniref:Uncharacterized protein n=1 Tax=Cucurbitaria berberidis CBS 394.84 TaxID=1168544 RepID=A0A9P4G6Z0_9PLEO|nr:uncharacterized protein K460DRAFT_202013 [Cucurbitaria berberidis CBS 394.84]KAF1840071.1 hypothetical protein K460DRAFT_202013 [Cucurbitaria berberidis CBS 394.84]